MKGRMKRATGGTNEAAEDLATKNQKYGKLSCKQKCKKMPSGCLQWVNSEPKKNKKKCEQCRSKIDGKKKAKFTPMAPTAMYDAPFDSAFTFKRYYAPIQANPSLHTPQAPLPYNERA